MTYDVNSPIPFIASQWTDANRKDGPTASWRLTQQWQLFLMDSQHKSLKQGCADDTGRNTHLPFARNEPNYCSKLLDIE